MTKLPGTDLLTSQESDCYQICQVSHLSWLYAQYPLTNGTESISPSVMIPDNRLATLLDHVKQNQINQCLYHNTALSPSLYSDHMCDRNDFPLSTRLELKQHEDEVWHCQFSHDGTKLVTAGKDSSVIIYDTSTFAVLFKLVEHEAGVAHTVWSPDDSKLITCSQDKTARVWSTEVCNLTQKDVCF
jgi:WD40 repeat protein